VKVSIVIPVYNEAKTVSILLEQVWNQPVGIDKEMVIVESNSTDGSREICQKFKSEKDAINPGIVKLVLQEKPRGKGNAMKEGLKNSTGDIILIQDADLEYDVTDYPSVLKPILDGKTSFVLGSRHLSAGSWKIRKFEGSPIKAQFLNFGGILFHGFFNIMFGTRLTDPTTMYKVFKRSCLEHFTMTGNRFDFDFELVGKLIRSGFPPLEVPISYNSRGFEEGKKVRMFHDPILWVRIILKTRFTKLK
jgi:glycosyltransferase involved in cell wall biosynthesis